MKCLTVLLSLVCCSFSVCAAEFDSAGFIRQHCQACHGSDGAVEGGVDLRLLAVPGTSENADPALMLKVIKVLRDREMPPVDEPPLSEKQRAEILDHLHQVLSKRLESYPFEPTPVRRMNRFQYNNAVVDLLQLDRDIFQLNERLMRRRDDYFDPASRRMPDQVRVSCRPLSKDIDGQRPEGFRGVAAFPQDQRAEYGFDNRADHLSLSPLLMESFLRLSESIVRSPDLNARECRLWDELFAEPGHPVRKAAAGRKEGESKGMLRLVQVTGGRAAVQDMRVFGKEWSADAQLFWRCPQAGPRLVLEFTVTKPCNGFSLGLTRAPDYGTFEVSLDDQLLDKSLDLFDTRVSSYRVDFPEAVLSPGPHRLQFTCVGKNAASARFFFGLDYADLAGVQPATSPEKGLSTEQVLRRRLRPFLRRAFRRPIDDRTLQKFVRLATSRLAAGDSFEDAMRVTVGAVLAMPEFLYLSESAADAEASGTGGEADPVGRERVTDFELATRLSQFFWSSLPDDRLLELAERAALSDRDVLSAEIDRMLNDRRAARFCENFAAQWLQLDRLITAIPDRQLFPYFYYNGYRTSMHMMSEPLLLFETVFIEDRSVLDLLNPDFTWQSSMLKANYQGHSNAGRDVQVQLFRRVPLEDMRRGGVITNAAVMTMTSTPVRTQPITRGAWVNAVIFNDPPEPPPADVPPLPETDAEELAKLTIRERLAVHRQRADCAGCHNRIDPLGFALENYGPTGVWREQYENGRDVDVSGVLFNEHRFQSLVEFKKLLVQQKQRFIRGFASHLLSYALARETGPADVPALESITQRAVDGDDSLRTLLKQIAMCGPFLHKNTGARPVSFPTKGTD